MKKFNKKVFYQLGDIVKIILEDEMTEYNLYFRNTLSKNI